MNFKDCIQFDNNIGKISVKIVPNSSKNMFIGLMKDGNYKIKLMALPEKNKANKELIQLIALEVAISERKIQIISGKTSTKKTLRIVI